MGVNANSVKAAVLSEPKDWRNNLIRRKDVPKHIRECIEHMVFSGLDRKRAAERVGISDHTLRKWLMTEPVMTYYTRQCEVLRRGERHRNLHVAVEVRDQSDSDKARLEAIKVLETDFDAKNQRGDGLHVTLNIAPGYIADVSPHADAARRLLAEQQGRGGRASKVIDHE